METYLATFHEEYVATVEGYVPEGARSRLTRYSLLPAVQVTGYVSTQLGAGYEYREGDGGISIIRGVAASVSFKAGTWSRDVLFAYLFATRQEGFWSEAHAVRRAKDEVLPALLDLQQSAARSLDLGTYLRTFEKRTILVLGDFKHGRDALKPSAELFRQGATRPSCLTKCRTTSTTTCRRSSTPWHPSAASQCLRIPPPRATSPRCSQRNRLTRYGSCCVKGKSRAPS